MSIQWFPGHMAKARRQVEERLKQVDVVMELLDARLPLSSRNPMMQEILSGKPRLVLLNKYDLADANANRLWLEYFETRGIQAVLIDARTGKGVQLLPRLAAELIGDRQKHLQNKGIQKKTVRSMVVGIPNVGKSSLINRLAGRSAAKTGDRPGVTKAQQWIKVGRKMQLLDTPGILWPKFDDPVIGQRLAASGAIKADIFPVEEVALFAVSYLRERYPDELKERYQLDVLSEDSVHVLEEIGKRRGCVASGGVVDWERAADALLRDLQSGKLGRVTLEFPEDWTERAK